MAGELIDAMPLGMGGMMCGLGKVPSALSLMKPMFSPVLIPRLLPLMVPKVMDRLMPHMIGEVVPLITQSMIDYMQGKS